MAKVITMPKMSDTMQEGVIAKWLKKVGDFVKEGDILAEVETDKATMELEAYESGTLLYMAVADGGTVAVDALLAIVGAEKEDFQHLLTQETTQNTVQETKAQVSQPTTTITESIAQPAAIPANVKIVTMPKMSDTMQEGVIAKWLKNIGDVVKAGDILAEVETDKATMELEAYDSGTLLYKAAEDGGSVQVDGLLAILGADGTDVQAIVANFGKTASVVAETLAVGQSNGMQTMAQTSSSNGSVSTMATTEGGRVKISPLAKKLAQEKGIDLQLLQGSGEGGRIVKRDVEHFQPATSSKSQPLVATSPVVSQTGSQTAAYEEVSVSQMRKTIARRLAESKFSAPHFYLTIAIEMDKAAALRQEINAQATVKISFNDLVIKAAALALGQHPNVNASWLGDKIRYYKQANIGVAVAVEEGLLVPVVRQAEQKTLSQIAAEVKDYAERAKNKKLQPADWEGNSFSISNLGMFGIEQFTAIINPPDACIMAVGAIQDVVKVREGQFYAAKEMKVTLSCDHRVVDGATGAAFLQTFKSLLENPMRILI